MAKKTGMTTRYIESYFRGLDQVGNTISDESINKLTDKLGGKNEIN